MKKDENQFSTIRNNYVFENSFSTGQERTNTLLFPFLRDATHIVHYSICIGNAASIKRPEFGENRATCRQFPTADNCLRSRTVSRSAQGYRLSIASHRPIGSFYFRITIIIVNGQMARYTAAYGRLQFRLHGQSRGRVFRFYFHRTF